MPGARSMKPSDLGLPARFVDFRRYAGFDQLAVAADLAATDDPRFQLVSAPPGAGKSLLVVTAGALRGVLRGEARMIVLTGTKSLQRQYTDDHPRSRWVWGHRNYPCASRASIFGIDTYDPEFRCSYPRESCPYNLDVEAAQESSIVVANYAYWMSIARYSDPDLLGEFDFLVCDEAHTAPHWLTDFVAVDVSRTTLRKWLDIDLPSLHATVDEFPAWAAWASKTVVAANELAGKETDPGSRRRLLSIARDLATVATVADEHAFAATGWQEPWTVYRTETGVRFSPRWGSDFSEAYLFRAIPHIVLCSATLSPETGDYLGIPRAATRYIEVPSPFDPRRRPVVWVPTTRVSHSMSEGAKSSLYRRVDEVIEAAAAVAGENGAPFKGLIQSQSYSRTAELLERSKYASLMISHKSSRELRDALHEFEASKNFCIFVSPSVKEGFDLGYVYWQIILKMPFLYSQDPLTKLRSETDKRYQVVAMGEALLQMFGRVVRSETDFGTTVIIDDMWSFVRNEAPFPAWSRASWKIEKNVPALLTRKSVGELREVVEVRL